MMSCIQVRSFRLNLTTVKTDAASSFETSITVYTVKQHHVQTWAKCERY
jgi:hypothetical protein